MRNRTARRTAASAVALVLMIVLTGNLYSAAQATQAAPRTTAPKPDTRSAAARTETSSAPPPDVLLQLNSALQELAAKVSPAVVQIVVTGFGAAREEDRSQTAFIVRQRAVGSGVIVDPSGYIITNAHVIEGAQRIRVALPLATGDSSGLVPLGKRRIVDARIVGLHKETDLALLKVEAKNLPTLSLTNQQQPRVGQLVFAIGSPEGLQNSVTMGVASAAARQADPSKPIPYVQTDAPINPGNSGGPLVDMNGSIIGINTFILSQGGGSEGLGFAIPGRVVEFVYQSLRKHGHVHRVEIGATAQEITPTMAEGLHLPQHWGVIVADVVPDGPAAAAGLKIQDIIVMADDRRIETLPSLTAALYLHRLDQAVKLDVLRGEERKTLFVPAIEHRDHMDEVIDAVNAENSLIPRLGVLAIDLTGELGDKLKSALRIPSGAIVVGRAAELVTPETGLQAGDVIHAMNGGPIDSTATLRSAVDALKTGDAVVLQIEREGALSYVSFEME